MTIAKIIAKKSENEEYLFKGMMLNFSNVLVGVDHIMKETLTPIKEKIIQLDIIEETHI